MPAELPSTEQICTETSRLVPLHEGGGGKNESSLVKGQNNANAVNNGNAKSVFHSEQE